MIGINIAGAILATFISVPMDIFSPIPNIAIPPTPLTDAITGSPNFELTKLAIRINTDWYITTATDENITLSLG